MVARRRDPIAMMNARKALKYQDVYIHMLSDLQLRESMLINKAGETSNGCGWRERRDEEAWETPGTGCGKKLPHLLTTPL